MPLTPRQIARKEWLESAVEAIQNAQMGIITSGKSQLSWNGRSVTNLSPDELESLRRSYESELERLERKEQGSGTRTVRVIG